MRLLYYSPHPVGGLADYAHAQANALVEQGAQVTMLCSSGYPARERANYQVVERLTRSRGPKRMRAAEFIRVVLSNVSTLENYIRKENFSRVLFGSYSEYLAPLWSGKLRRLAARGVVFGAIIHDPVRDFVLGPKWWHNWSIACGYSFLREAFVHEAVKLDTGRPMPQLRTTVIPHGTYNFAAPNENREEIRRRLQLPENARVMLSFGHIRDGKNLDLVLHAMKQVGDIHLVVAGRPQSSRQKQPHFYQRLATDLGVADRCHWIIDFIPEGEVGNLFVASDIVLLAYGHGFRSASGVLNAAVFFRKPCLASGGSGNLRTMIQKYGLGTWIEPDNIDSLITGMRKAMYEPPSPRWNAYEGANSWEANAAIVIRTFFGDAR